MKLLRGDLKVDKKRRYKIASLTTVAGTTKAFLVDQLEAFEQAGIEVTVLCANDPDLLKCLSKEIRFIPVDFNRVLSPIKDLNTLFHLYRIFRKEKFDLIQYASPKASLLGSTAAFWARVPIRIYLLWGLYYEGQSGIKKSIYKFFEKLISLYSTHILPNSHEMANIIIKEKIAPERKSEVLLYGSACGIDFEKFDINKWRSHRKTVRHTLGTAEDSIVIGIFGRLTGDKGVNEAVDAFVQIAKQVPNAYLLIIGNLEEKDPPLPSSIKQIEKHPRILSLPYQQSLLPFYAAIDIICLPTYREGFPQTPLEAQAMEVPVVSTDISGVREAVENHKTGFLVEPRNSRALIEPIMKLIENESLRKQMGQEGRKRVYEMFNQKHIMRTTVQHRLSLLTKKNLDNSCTDHSGPNHEKK